MLIGFNTSYTEIISLEEKTELFLEIGCNAIEFSMSTLEREKQLSSKWENFPWEKFAYRSLHAPCRYCTYNNNPETVALLERIQILQDKYQFNLVVFHPDTIKDLSILKNYNLPVAFENMDQRKEIARDVASLTKVFSELDAKMVLDLNHCFANDNTMNLSDDFYSAFKDRIAEIHLSGFDTLHDPLYKTEQRNIIEAIPDKNIPIIIESLLNTKEDIRKEFEYITNILNK
jgi:hypothetical protein